MFLGISVSLKAQLLGGGAAPPSGYVLFVPLGSTGMTTSNGDTFASKAV